MTTLGIHENTCLRYAGGKARRATRLLRFADNKSRLVEPFCGAASIFFRARRERLFRSYCLSDIDDRVINFWLTLRDRPEELLQHLWNLYQVHGYGDEVAFQRYRSCLDCNDPIERAAAYFWINKWAVNGNESGGMIKTAKRRNGITPRMLQRLPAYSDLLQGVEIAQKDYWEVAVTKDTFLFLDPPYENVGATLYRSTVDLVEFRDWVVTLPATWMVTLNDSAFTRELFRDFDILTEPVKYSVLGSRYGTTGTVHRDATEIVVMNYHRRPTRNLFAKRFGWTIRNATNAA